MILYAYGVYQYHGRVYFTWLWTERIAGGRRPPRCALDLQLRIQDLIARVVMAFCYWFGRLLLGMKGKYPEYTLPMAL